MSEDGVIVRGILQECVEGYKEAFRVSKVAYNSMHIRAVSEGKYTACEHILRECFGYDDQNIQLLRQSAMRGENEWQE